MSDPLNPSEREKRETAFANETRPYDPRDASWPADEYSRDNFPVPEDDPRIIHQERLFSRRVLFGWAFATLLVVFAVTVILPMVVPIVKETVMTNVVARMRERGMNVRVNGADMPAIPNVPEVPAIPPVPEVPATPAAPVVAGEPAPARAPVAPTPPHHKTPVPASSSRR